MSRKIKETYNPPARPEAITTSVPMVSAMPT